MRIARGVLLGGRTRGAGANTNIGLTVGKANGIWKKDGIGVSSAVGNRRGAAGGKVRNSEADWWMRAGGGGIG